MDPEKFRSYFPTLQKNVYLSSCSLGARSSALDESMESMLEDMNKKNAWCIFEEKIEILRRHFANLIHAKANQITIIPNASVGAYQIASTLEWKKRYKIITTSAEFPSIAHVWLAQKSRGASVSFVENEKKTEDIIFDYTSQIDKNTKLVSIPLIAYSNGLRHPVKDITKVTSEAGGSVFIDAYQATGIEPIDVNDLGCDYLVAGTMKYLLGLPGIAFLYVRSCSSTDKQPELTGWFGRKEPLSFNPYLLDFPDTARQFETGTASIPSVYAAIAGINLINQLNLKVVKSYISELVQYAFQKLTAQGEKLNTLDSLANYGAHIALIDQNPDALSSFLSNHRVFTSPRGEGIRISFHYYNNKCDIEELCRVIKIYRTQFDGDSND